MNLVASNLHVPTELREKCIERLFIMIHHRKLNLIEKVVVCKKQVFDENIKDIRIKYPIETYNICIGVLSPMMMIVDVKDTQELMDSIVVDTIPTSGGIN